MRAVAAGAGLIVTAAVLLAVAAEAAAGPPRRPKAPHRLLVISVDGLDWRYLKDADRLGLRIPTLRRLMAEGDVADGVVGENPTITWPAHTTLITGVPPRRHGILGNGRPGSETGSRHFDTSMLTAPTLWQAAKAAGLTVGVITWPVTVSPQIDFDLPEYFEKGHGEGMDLATLAAKATPGLIERIGACYPEFLEPVLTDRTRTLAALYMTRTAGADLALLHLMDLDADSHEHGPFTPAANATLERTDARRGAHRRRAARPRRRARLGSWIRADRPRAERAGVADGAEAGDVAVVAGVVDPWPRRAGRPHRDARTGRHS